MLLRQFCLGINLLTRSRENTDFPCKKPRQLVIVKVNFEDCVISVVLIVC